MKIIVDTTISKQATVILLEGEKEIISKTGTDALLLVSDILKEKGLEYKEVEFELKNQPGSYTGLKVGASVVNTLNFLKGEDKLVTPKY